MRLLRVTATFRRCAKRWNDPRHKFESTQLPAQELQEAERLWIKDIQEHEFHPQLQLLRSASKQPTALVTRLSLYKDEHGFIRCEGRIENSSQELAAKHPILIPAKHLFTDLFIREHHKVVHHNGIRGTLNSIREKYWIQRGRGSKASGKEMRCV